MKSNTLFLLLGVAAVLLVAATAFVGQPARTVTPADLGSALNAKIDMTTLQKIQIDRGGDQLELVRSGAGFWEVPAAGGYPANDLLKTLEEAVAGLHIDDRLADQADGSASDECLALYHLTAKAGTRIKMLDDKNQALIDVIIGCVGPGRSGVCFRRADRPEVLISFDSRLAALPVATMPWVRLEMGLIDPRDMILEFQRPGEPKLSLVQYQGHWIVQGIKRGAKNEPLESPDPTVLQSVVGMATSLSCEGIYPPETTSEGMDFDAVNTSLTCRNSDNSVIVIVSYGTPRVLPNARLRDGNSFDQPVVPVRIRITMRDAASLPEYVAYFNRKAEQRLFWIRKTTFDDLFVAHDKLMLPLETKPQVDPRLLNPLPAHGEAP